MATRDLFHPDQFRSFANLAEAFFYNADLGPDLVAYDQAQIDRLDDRRRRTYVTTLQHEAKTHVLKIATHLEAMGVKPGDAVTILSLDRGEWTEAEMAVYTVGGVLVPTYVRDPPERVRQILCDAQVKFAFVENQEQLDKLLDIVSHDPDRRSSSALNSGVPILKGIVAFEDVSAPASQQGAAPSIVTMPSILSQSAVRHEGSFACASTPRDAIACIFYTSGSTGDPKGVPVTHGQTLENLRQIAEARLIDYAVFAAAGWTGIQPFVSSILPERAHVFPARIGQLAATTPVRTRFPAVVDRRSSRITPEFRESWRRDLREGGSGIVLVVPQILTLIQQRVRQGLSAAGFMPRLARLIMDNAIRKILLDRRGAGRLSTNLTYWLLAPLRRMITRKIRDRIVSRDFKFFVAGGAKLPVETAAMLGALGLPAYEGYGSTETNCPIAANTPLVSRLGSVGKPFVDIQIRIEPLTGEILVRGPNVAQQYWHLPEESAAGWTADGWCRTRDVGRIDADGYLYVDDRMDGILVLQNGENVSATAIAARFAPIPIVETVVVLGHHRPALIALVALNEALVRKWASDTGHVLADEWRHDPAVLDLLRGAVDELVNGQAQHGFERIRHVGIINTPDPMQRTMTATEKVRRNEIEKQYAALIERLYAEQAAEPRRRTPLVEALQSVAAM